MKIPITKPFFDKEEEDAVGMVIRSGWVSQGVKVKEFEEKFAAYVGSKYAVATTSCTTALHAALSVSGVGLGDEVIVPSLSFIATANAVIHAGAIPVFADVDPETCNVTVETIQKAISNKTKAVIPVHQMGLPVDLDPIIDLCKKKNFILIEDAACAIGSEYKGKKIRGHDNITCFSFHPRKIITTGEGGMITTDDPEVAEKAKRFRHHGMSVSDIDRHIAEKVIIETYPEIGYNYRMTDMQAAMGIVQLNKIPFIIKRRREIAEFYNEELGRISCIKVPKIPNYAYHNYQSYWIELLDSLPVARNLLMEKLLEKGVTTRRGIMAIHMERCYSKYEVSLPVTEKITKNTVLLPIYPSMTEEENKFIVDRIKETLK